MRFKVAIFLFVGLSLYCTVAKKEIYPLNPYHMFSRNWLKQQEIPGIEAYDNDGSRIPLWKGSTIPFFQINRVAIRTYYGSSEKTKLRLCQWLRDKFGTQYIELQGVRRRYTRVNGLIQDDPIYREKVFECSSRTL